jgi:hypothetical protein
MRRYLVITSGLLLVIVPVACSSSGSPSGTLTPTQPTSAGPSPSGVTGGAGTIIRPSGSNPPTSSPGITGSVTKGAASITTTGAQNTTVAFTRLTSAIWAPPPNGMALQWDGADDQTLSLGGPAFTSLQPTSASRVLAFSIRTTAGSLVEFRSAAGECQVTISVALTNDMGGIFDCPSVASVDGSITVHARGSFTATG